MDDRQQFSRMCRALRFPLMLLVVLIHLDYQKLLSTAPDPAAYSFYFLLTHVVARVAVPCFFLMSGYYFFFDKKDKPFTPKAYLRKLSSRATTLLLPFVVWNLITIFFKVFYLHRDLVSCLTLFPFPPAIQFWYIRDLLILSLLSPLVFLLIRYLKFFYLLLVTIFYLLGTDVFIDVSLLYFSLGAFLAIFRLNPSALLRGTGLKILPFFFVLLLADVLLNTTPFFGVHTATNNLFVHRLFIICATITLFSLAYKFFLTHDSSRLEKLSPFSFFLFAIHLPLTINLFFALLFPLFRHGNFAFVCLYLLPPVLSVLFSGLLYFLLDRYIPQVLSFLCGTRTRKKPQSHNLQPTAEKK